MSNMTPDGTLTGAAQPDAQPASAVARPIHNFYYLQYVRGIAALMVVYFHALVQLDTMGIATPLPRIGEPGVDLFFVLSGFLMWVTTVNSKMTPLTFMRKRIIRVIPLYWTLTLFAAGVALVAPNVLKHTVLEGHHLIASLLFWPAPNPAYTGAGEQGMLLTPLLVPGWTLNYEAFFYVLFGLMMFVKPTARLLLLPALFGVLVWANATFNSHSPALAVFGHPMVFEFYFGVLVAVMVKRGWYPRPTIAAAMLTAGIAAMVILNLRFTVEDRLLAFGLPATWIVYCLCALELQRPALRSKWLQAIGDASYSLYLTHVFSLPLCRLVFQHLTTATDLFTQLLFCLACELLSITVGLMVFRAYEQPIANYLSRYRR
jgi:exopolysaccharide production protein ExoZ